MNEMVSPSARFLADHQALLPSLRFLHDSPVLFFHRCAQERHKRKFKFKKGITGKEVDMDDRFFLEGQRGLLGDAATDLVIFFLDDGSGRCWVFLRIKKGKNTRHDGRANVDILPLPGQDVPEGFFDLLGLKATFASLVGASHRDSEAFVMQNPHHHHDHHHHHLQDLQDLRDLQDHQDQGNDARSRSVTPPGDGPGPVDDGFQVSLPCVGEAMPWADVLNMDGW